MVTTLLAERALLPEGWASDVAIVIGEGGDIVSVGPAKGARGDRAKGPVLPGMPNLHSHAFQRAMAGLTETAGNSEDSFWTWRELMYRMVGRLDPDHVQAIATHLYIDMLKGGYASVAEFHYVHHDRDGSPYADPAEMARRVLAASSDAGIGISLLPVLYRHGGFGGKPAAAGQRRFLHETDAYLSLLRSLEAETSRPGRALGACFHSLRAVTPEDMRDVLAARQSGPVHIHIAEQQKEIDDCLAWSGQRPIAWLYANFAVDPRWCLVHATHAEADEVTSMARSGAIVGLCPTTEANLGDGLFPAVDYAAQSGVWGIGSDSHVSLSVVEELRWLEYGQRLQAERRNRLHVPGRTNVAGYLYRAALAGGAQASGRKIGRIEAGCRADLVVLDGADPLMDGTSDDAILSRWLFGGTDRLVRDVMVGGDWVIADRHHKREAEAGRAFTNAVKALIAD